MVRFTLFGIPVEIQPWFWLTAALFGGLTKVQKPEDMKYTLIFMLASTVSILVHEFGHALTGRKLAGGRPHVVLWAFGGLAYNETARFTRTQNFWMTFMGPGAGFLLFGLVALALVIAFGPGDAGALLGGTLFGITPVLSESTYYFFQDHIPLRWLIHSFLWINFWWGMINLLPVLPLDGGRIAELYIRPQAKVHQICIATGVAMALVGGLWMKSFYVAVLFGYLAFRNYQWLQDLQGRRGGRY